MAGKGMGAKAALFQAHIQKKLETGDCTVVRGTPGFGGDIRSIVIPLDRMESFAKSILDSDNTETTWPLDMLLTKGRSCPQKRCLRQAIKRFGFRVVPSEGKLTLNWMEALSKAQREQQLKGKNRDLWQRAAEASRKADKEGAIYVRATERGNVPSGFMCPITMSVMQNPVVAADGQSYEEHAILKWMSTRRTSPMTNKQLLNTDTYPNYALRSMIRDWLCA